MIEIQFLVNTHVKFKNQKMKTTTVFAIVIALFIVFSCSNNEQKTTQLLKDSLTEKPVFRNISWNMNNEQIKSNETGKLIQDTLSDEGNPLLVYEDLVMNENALIVYIFDNSKKIERTSILFDTDILKDKEYIAKYFRVLKNMTEKYGNPTDKTQWLGSMYKSTDTLNYGNALMLNQVAFSQVWQNSTIGASIILQLQNNDNTIYLTASYIPESVANKIVKTNKENEQKGY